MSVAAPEAAAKPDSPPETTGYRNLYILLLVCGFILRFGFVLWKKTYIRAPGSFHPFGPEVCSIAEHIVLGQGFSSPFYQDTGPTAWVAPVYPYLAALVFRLFGIYSVASAIVLLGIQCIIAAATGIAIHALGRRTLGAQIGFFAAWIWALSPICFRWPVSWIWDFTASAFLLSAAFIVTLDVAQKNTRKLWLSLGALWAVIALTNPALLSVMPFTFLYAAFVNHRSFRPWFASMALAGVLFAALVSPWLIRNEIVFGRLIVFRSNFWFEFHFGNYHFSNGMGYSGKHPDANAAEFPSQNTATPSSPSFFCSPSISYSFSGAKFAPSHNAERDALRSGSGSPRFSNVLIPEEPASQPRYQGEARVDFLSAAHLRWHAEIPCQSGSGK